ncbi:MAG: hypothetical protein QOC60_1563 [Frankiaceae bacterium]|nr:hypothetical protein [Frankiaceae bacterium]
MTDTCPDCGAAMVPEATWCLGCNVPKRPDTLVAEAGERNKATKVVPEYSRTKAGVSSFGLTGRVTITVATLLMLVFLLNFNILGGILWLVVAVPLILKDTWKRARIR